MTTTSHRAAYDLTRMDIDPPSRAWCAPGACPVCNPEAYAQIAAHRGDTQPEHLDLRDAAALLADAAYRLDDSDYRAAVIGDIISVPGFAARALARALRKTADPVQRARIHHAARILGITR